MKKLWPRQVRKEKPVAVQKISRDRKCCRDRKLVSRQKVGVVTEDDFATGNGVATEAGVAIESWCRDRRPVSRPETLQQPEKGRKLSF